MGVPPAEDPLLRDLLNRPLLSCFSFDMSFEDDFFLIVPETFFTDSSGTRALVELGSEWGTCMHAAMQYAHRIRKGVITADT